MCYFCHQLKQKQNTEWMLYKCTNTNPEQLLEQVMTILLKAQLHFTKSYYLIIISTSCQVNVIVYASEAGGILSCINKKPLRSLPHDTPEQIFVWVLVIFSFILFGSNKMPITLSFLYLHMRQKISMTFHFISNTFVFISLAEKISSH